MSFRRLKFTGFTDRRRRQLAKKVDRLERLERATRSPNRSVLLDLRSVRSRERAGLALFPRSAPATRAAG